MSWRDQAERAIAKALRASEGLPAADRIKAVDAAYPFGQRAFWPYKVWLDVRRRALDAHGLKAMRIRGWRPGDPAPLQLSFITKPTTAAPAARS